MDIFNKFSDKAALFVGSSWTFAAAFALIIFWVLVGPLFKFSDTWQLVINTLTTIITFLIVFLIQNTQNRDMEKLQIKLDELIEANSKTKKSVIDLDKLSDKQLRELEKHYKEISAGKK